MKNIALKDVKNFAYLADKAYKLLPTKNKKKSKQVQKKHQKQKE